jgi:diguanylate cyclase (GGDEF)-like protein
VSEQRRERRNPAIRARRDTIAAWFEIHPRELAGLPEDVVLTMAQRLEGEGRLHGQIAELRSTAQRWEVLARTDALTGLANRRAAEERLAIEIKRAARYARPLSVLLADVDRLKAINDLHGHAAGDVVLRELARRLSGVVRASDLLARWGGDEFLMICPEAGHLAAAQIADKLVREARTDVPVGEVTVSCGLSVGWGTTLLSGDDVKGGVDALLRNADEALYRSKVAGRDRASGPA